MTAYRGHLKKKGERVHSVLEDQVLRLCQVDPGVQIVLLHLKNELSQFLDLA